MATAVAAAAAPVGAGTVTETTISPFKTGTSSEFLAGSGIPGTDFVITTNETTNDQLALKIRNRFPPLGSVSGNRYTIREDDGVVGNSDDFQFDYQFTPGNSNAGAYNDFFIRFLIDIDPTSATAFNQTAFRVTDANTLSSDQSLDDGDGFFTSGYSPSDAQFVISNSVNLTAVAAASFLVPDFGPGEYTVRLELLDATTVPTGELVASVEAIGVVIPEPMAAMAGLSLLSLVGLRRRQVTA